jgi:hypothetical protein
LIASYRDGKLVSEEPVTPSRAPVGKRGILGLVDTLIAGEVSNSEFVYERLTDGLTTAEMLTHVIGPTWFDAVNAGFVARVRSITSGSSADSRRGSRK